MLRAIDKYDRLGREGVEALLGSGRKDDSGDFTKGAGLDALTNSKSAQLRWRNFSLMRRSGDLEGVLSDWSKELGSSAIGNVRDLRTDANSPTGACGKLCDPDRISIDSSVVRGLEYYTGPVFEVDLTFPIAGDDGKPIRFGSVGGGGRYDGLVSRFRGEPVPATGFSIGVSRLAAALQHLGKLESKPEPGPVVVTVFDKDRLAEYQNHGRQAARTQKSAPNFISAIRAISAISSNMPTSATHHASSFRAATKRPRAKSRSRI